MKKVFNLLRVKHYVKNLLIFIPMICAGVVDIENLVSTFIGLVSFCLVTSVVYIINDIKDIEKDKMHPRKKYRPIASGKIKVSNAIIIGIILFVFSVVLGICFLNVRSIVFMIVYLVLNILYSFGLKNIVILDVMLLSSSLLLRVYYGASIVNVEVSNWLFLTMLSASLFLGLGKRRKEYKVSKDSRIVLKDYNEEFLEKYQYLTLTLTIVFYSLWATSQSNDYLYLSIPLIIVIFMKYSLNIEKNDEGDPTTILFNDKVLMGLCLLYGIFMLVVLLVK